MVVNNAFKMAPIQNAVESITNFVFPRSQVSAEVRRMDTIGQLNI